MENKDLYTLSMFQYLLGQERCFSRWLKKIVFYFHNYNKNLYNKF